MDNTRCAGEGGDMQERAIEQLLQQCKQQRWTRIGLYGAGKHTERLLENLQKRGAKMQVTAIFDDHKAGTQINGIPVALPADWRLHDVQALIISSDAHEEVLFQKAQTLKPSIPIVRLYIEDWPTPNPYINKLVEEISNLPADMHAAGTMMTPVLRAMARLTRDMELKHTVETGSGKTTLLLSNMSKKHTVFSIDDGNRSITSVRASPLLRAERVEWVEGPSQWTLPKYIFADPIDFALIDGPHGYPFPEMEYYYIYQHLAPGALLAIDDIHIPTITNLFNFLKEEVMFELAEVVMTTAFFRRTNKPLFSPTGDGWWLQGYNRNHFPLHEHPYLTELLTKPL